MRVDSLERRERALDEKLLKAFEAGRVKAWDKSSQRVLLTRGKPMYTERRLKMSGFPPGRLCPTVHGTTVAVWDAGLINGLPTCIALKGRKKLR